MYMYMDVTSMNLAHITYPRDILYRSIVHGLKQIRETDVSKRREKWTMMIL